MRKLAEELVKYAKQKGASQAEISISEGRKFSANVREQEIEKLEQAGSRGLSLKVIVDERAATASSSDFNKDTLHRLVDNAIERAKLSSPDPYSKLPELSTVKVSGQELEIYDPAVENLSPDEKIKTAMEMEKIGMADKRITVSGGASYYSNIGSTVLANSNGFSGSYKSTSVTAFVDLQAGDKENPVEDYWYESSHFANGISSPEEIASKAIERVTRLIGSKKIKTQNVPIIFDRSMSSALLGFFAQCVNGRAVYMKNSFLTDKIGESAAASGISIIDNGLLPKGLGSRPFDNEGVPSQKTPIIENGVLKNYILDTYSARKLDMKSTGNSGGTTNFYMEAGRHKPEEIISSVKQGLFFVKSMGQGTNSTTGDYSKGAYGIWIENGRLTYPVAEITVSGNLGDMLKNIEMVGNDLVFDRSTTAPTIKIKEMTISGI